MIAVVVVLADFVPPDLPDLFTVASAAIEAFRGGTALDAILVEMAAAGIGTGAATARLRGFLPGRCA